jgi:4-hydroxyproline epimerase
VGTVHTELHQDGEVSVRNVPAFRHLRAVGVQVPGYGEVRGDVAWGGNWFFLVERSDLALALGDLPALLDFTNRIRAALEREGVTGAGGALIDHIEICGRPHDPSNDGRNFVLCPGGAYDRSPCGTGTSARLACLYADGRLAPGRKWRQESVTGSVFAGHVDVEGGAIIPTIRGSAWITAESTLVFCPGDPLGPPAAAGIMPT